MNFGWDGVLDKDSHPCNEHWCHSLTQELMQYLPSIHRHNHWSLAHQGGDWMSRWWSSLASALGHVSCTELCKNRFGKENRLHLCFPIWGSSLGIGIQPSFQVSLCHVRQSSEWQSSSYPGDVVKSVAALVICLIFTRLLTLKATAKLPSAAKLSAFCSEAILSPGIPSVAARSGGLILPLVVSMSEACGSKANDGTASRIGAYLIMTIFQVDIALLSSIMHTIWAS